MSYERIGLAHAFHIDDSELRKDWLLRAARSITRDELESLYQEIENSSTARDDQLRQEALSRVYTLVARQACSVKSDTQVRAMLLGAKYNDCVCNDPRYEGATHAVVILHGVTVSRQSAVVKIHGVTPHMFVDLSRILTQEPSNDTHSEFLRLVRESESAYRLAALALVRKADAKQYSERRVPLHMLTFLDGRIVAQVKKPLVGRNMKWKQRQEAQDDDEEPGLAPIASLLNASIMWARSYYSYSDIAPFLRIDTTHPQVIPSARKVFEQIGSLWPECPALPPCECDVEFITRALVDMDLRGGNWFDVAMDQGCECTRFDESSNASTLFAVAVKHALPGQAPWFKGDVSEKGDWRKYVGRTLSNNGSCKYLRKQKTQMSVNIKHWWDTRVEEFSTTPMWPNAAPRAAESVYHNGKVKTAKSSIGNAVFGKSQSKPFGLPGDESSDSENEKQGDTRAEHRISAGVVVDVPSPSLIISRGSSVAPFSTIADIRTLSFDIECAGYAGRFPDAKEDRIITICMSLQDRQSIPSSMPDGPEPGSLEMCRCSKINFQVGRFDAVVPNEIAPLPAPQVFIEDKPPPGAESDERRVIMASVWFASELQMLLAFRDFIMSSDPDIIIGYNNCAFDFRYIFDRMQVLQKSWSIPAFTRFPTEVARMTRKMLSTRAFGSVMVVDVPCSGRVVLDLLSIMRREYKLRSYTLNAVGETFVESKKEDLPHERITPYFYSRNPELCGDLARYCSTDTVLPLRLLQKLLIETSIMEMCRATGILPAQLYTRGQSIKTMALLYRDCLANGVVIPTRSSASPYPAMRGEQEGKYPGAFVVPPAKGVHRDLIATLDFSSLYPSIMIAHNLCHTTWVPVIVPIGINGAGKVIAAEGGDAHSAVTVVITPEQMVNMENDLRAYNLHLDNVEVSPEGYVFVRSTVRKGSMPRILEQVLRLRKQAKKDLANAEEKHDKDMARVYDKRQLALKIVANSIYGFTGDRNGKLPCSGIAKSVTGYGRSMIALTIETVLTEFTRDKRGMMPRTHPAVALALSRDSTLDPDKIPWCPCDARVYAGDTDSVMFSVGIDIAVHERMFEYIMEKGKKQLALTYVGVTVCKWMADIGLEAAKIVTKKFPSPIAILFEKLLIGSMILVAKKRYASVSIELDSKSPTGFTKPKMFVRGLESVRRDNCKMVPKLISSILEEIIVNRDSCAAIRETALTIERLRTGRYDISQLIITKQYSKVMDAFSGKQAHVEIAKRMGLTLGDRIPYLNAIVEKNAPAYKRSVHPIELISQNKVLDNDYYVVKQLMKPVCRILGAVAQDAFRMFDSKDRLCTAIVELQREDKYAHKAESGPLTVEQLRARRECKMLARHAIDLAKKPIAAFQELQDNARAEDMADGEKPTMRTTKGLLSVASVGMSRYCIICHRSIGRHDDVQETSIGPPVAEEPKVDVKKAIVLPPPKKKARGKKVDAKQKTLVFSAPKASPLLDECLGYDELPVVKEIAQIQDVAGILCTSCMATTTAIPIDITIDVACQRREAVALLRMELARVRRKVDTSIKTISIACNKCHATTTGHVVESVPSVASDVSQMDVDETDDICAVAYKSGNVLPPCIDELHRSGQEYTSSDVVNALALVASTRWKRGNIQGAERIYQLVQCWDPKSFSFMKPGVALDTCPWTVDIEDLTRSCSNTDCDLYFKRINQRLDRVRIAIVECAAQDENWYTLTHTKFVQHPT